jgi:hypothetical protein
LIPVLVLVHDVVLLDVDMLKGEGMSIVAVGELVEFVNATIVPTDLYLQEYHLLVEVELVPGAVLVVRRSDSVIATLNLELAVQRVQVHDTSFVPNQQVMN